MAGRGTERGTEAVIGLEAGIEAGIEAEQVAICDVGRVRAELGRTIGAAEGEVGGAPDEAEEREVVEQSERNADEDADASRAAAHLAAVGHFFVCGRERVGIVGIVSRAEGVWRHE